MTRKKSGTGPAAGPAGTAGAAPLANIDDLTLAEAHAVLGRLWDSGAELQARIRAEIEGLLAEVDAEAVAGAVFFDLDGIEVDELWERSGSTRHGYVDSTEEAWEMVEGTLRPYIDELERFLRLDMHTRAFSHCLGVLQGIFAFGTESSSEFLQWAEDYPQAAFELVLDKWRRSRPSQELRKRMDDELRKRCPGWPRGA